MNILRIAVSIVGALIGAFVLILAFLFVLNLFGVSHPYWGGTDNVTASTSSVPGDLNGDGKLSDTEAVLLAISKIGNSNTSGSGATNATTTPTPAATQAPTTAPAAGTGKMPDLPIDASHGKWTIKENADIDKDPVVRDFLKNLCDPDPAHGRTFPNVPNPDPGTCAFDVSNGLEYGVANVPFCQQDQRCDFVVPAWHYRLATADYGFLDLACMGEGKKGCALTVVNVMDQSYTWRDQAFDNGFSVPGRYWNGDKLDQGLSQLVNHVSANMLGMRTDGLEGEVLNSGNGDDAGANCGTPKACGSVDFTIVIAAGDRILAVAKTTVTP